MVVSKADIRRIMPNAPKDIDGFVKAFNQYAPQFGIDTKLRICGFLSQVAVETGELKSLEENMNYSERRLLQVFPRYFTAEQAKQYANHPEKIGSRVYANRMGNGNEASGDGYKFRGRGCIMLTGREAYKKYADSVYCVGNLMAHPEWLGKYPGALKSAMWFWNTKGLNELADNEQISAICKRVNGGTNGYSQRLYYWRMAKRVFGV